MSADEIHNRIVVGRKRSLDLFKHPEKFLL